jgi:hypothetical protein
MNHVKRLAIFCENLHKINLHNTQFARGAQTYAVGVNHLADLTAKELSARLTAKPIDFADPTVKASRRRCTLIAMMW